MDPEHGRKQRRVRVLGRVQSRKEELSWEEEDDLGEESRCDDRERKWLGCWTP